MKDHAMKFKSNLLAQASGRLGGSVYSHNAGGMYIRNGSTPVNPQSAAQTVIRNAMSGLVTAWSGVLTQQQRDDWSNYAANVPVTNVFGDPILISGLAMYTRCNVPRRMAGLPDVDDGPTTMLEAPAPSGLVLTATDAPLVQMAFTDSEQWANEEDAALIIQLGRQQSPGVNFFAGPFRFAAAIEGDSLAPPTTPATVADPFNQTLLAGNKIWARARVSLADGRLSPVVLVQAVVT